MDITHFRVAIVTGKERERTILIPYTNSTRSQILEHLLAVLLLKWLPYIFNGTPCNY